MHHMIEVRVAVRLPICSCFSVLGVHQYRIKERSKAYIGRGFPGRKKKSCRACMTRTAFGEAPPDDCSYNRSRSVLI